MVNMKSIRGDNLNIAVQDVRIELLDGNIYEISPEDKFTFSMSLARGAPVLVRKDDEIERVNDTLIVKISNAETEKLKCLSYDFDLKIDMKGRGENIYTVVNGAVEILPTVTEVKDG